MERNDQPRRIPVPRNLARRCKAEAALRGETLEQFVARAIAEVLEAPGPGPRREENPR